MSTQSPPLSRRFWLVTATVATATGAAVPTLTRPEAVRTSQSSTMDDTQKAYPHFEEVGASPRLDEAGVEIRFDPGAPRDQR